MSPKESVKNERVIDLVRSGVETEGVRGFARSVGISPAIVSRYMKGEVGEPTNTTLKKIADYFEVTVAWLRGEEIIDLVERMSAEEMFMLALKCSFPGGEERVYSELIVRGFDEEYAVKFLQSLKSSFSSELRAKMWERMLSELYIDAFKPLINTAFSVVATDDMLEDNKLAEVLSEVAVNLEREVIKPLIDEVLKLPASEIPAAAAIIKRFASNDKFNLEVRKLLNSSIAHSR